MQAGLLDSIIHTRSGLKRRGVCCVDLPISSEMVVDIGTTKVYDHKNVAEDEEIDEVFDFMGKYDYFKD